MKEIGSVLLQKERVTKGAVLYKNDSSGLMTSVYLRKSGLETPYPDSIEVSIVTHDKN